MYFFAKTLAKTLFSCFLLEAVGTETLDYPFTFTFSTRDALPTTTVPLAVSTVPDNLTIPSPSVSPTPSSLSPVSPILSSPRGALDSLTTRKSRRTSVRTIIPTCIKQSVCGKSSVNAHQHKMDVLRKPSSFLKKKPSFLLTIPSFCSRPRPGGSVRDIRQQKRLMEAVVNRHIDIVHSPKERDAKKIVKAPTLEDLATLAQQRKAVIDEALSRPHIVNLELFDPPTSGVEALLKAADIIRGTAAPQDTRLERPPLVPNGVRELLKAAKQLDTKLLPPSKPPPVLCNPVIATLAKGYGRIDFTKIPGTTRSPTFHLPTRETTFSRGTSSSSFPSTSPSVTESSTRQSSSSSCSGARSGLRPREKSSISHCKGKGEKVSFKRTVFCRFYFPSDPPNALRTLSFTISPLSSTSCDLGPSINKPATSPPPRAWVNAEAGPSKLPKIVEETLHILHPSSAPSELPPCESVARQNYPFEDVLTPPHSPVMQPALCEDILTPPNSSALQAFFSQRPLELKKRTKHTEQVAVRSRLVQQDLGSIETSNDGAPAPIPVVLVNEPNITLPAAGPSYSPVVEAPSQEVLADSGSNSGMDHVEEEETGEVREGGFFFGGRYYQEDIGNTISSSDATNIQEGLWGIVQDISTYGSSAATSSSSEAHHEAQENTDSENNTDTTKISTASDGSAVGNWSYSGENVMSAPTSTTIPPVYAPISPIHAPVTLSYSPPETNLVHSALSNERFTSAGHDNVYHPLEYNTVTDAAPTTPWTTPRPLQGVPPPVVPSFEPVATDSIEGTTAVAYREGVAVGPLSLATTNGSMAATGSAFAAHPEPFGDGSKDMEDVRVTMPDNICYDDNSDYEMFYVDDDMVVDEPFGEEPAQVEVIPERTPTPLLSPPQHSHREQPHHRDTWDVQPGVHQTQRGLASSWWESCDVLSNDNYQRDSSAPGWDSNEVNPW